MILGIMSDSHDHMVLIRRAADTFRQAGAAAIIHAGDLLSAHAFEYLKDIGVPFHGVFGNTDRDRAEVRAAFAPIGSFHDGRLELVLGGLRIAVVHDDRRAVRLARGSRYDVVIYGHTHEIDVRTIGTTLLVNPGEVCGWCSGRSTVALLDTQTRAVEIRDLISPA
jgi:putative phosphoesterase